MKKKNVFTLKQIILIIVIILVLITIIFRTLNKTREISSVKQYVSKLELIR